MMRLAREERREEDHKKCLLARKDFLSYLEFFQRYKLFVFRPLLLLA